MDRTLPSVRSARFAQRARRMGLATAVVASLALGTVVASPAGAAPVVPFAPVATIAVPAGVSDVSVSADGADLLAFSAEDSSLVSIDLDACDTTAFGLDAQDCDIDWSAPLADDAQAWFVDSSGAGQVFVIAQRGPDGVLTRFDRGSGAVIGTPIVLPGHTVHALTYVPAVNTAYVLAEDGVVLVDVVAGIVTGTIEPRSEAPEPGLADGQQAIIYNAFSTGSTSSPTPQGIVYAAYGEYLTTVNVATGARVETTRRLTTSAGISPTEISDPVAATPSLFVAGTLATGTYRTFGISSEAVHGRDQNAVYLYNTTATGSTSTSAAAWVAKDPRGLALSTTTNQVFAASTEDNTISVVDATGTGTTAPKPLIESLSLDTAGVTTTGSIDIGGLAVATVDSGVAVYAANPSSRTITVLEREPLLDGAVPAISGDARVGETLTVAAGEWGGAELGYHWLADGVPIDGATDETYVVSPDDLGSALTVAVTGVQSGFAPTRRTSAPTALVSEGTLVSDVPSITGAAVVDAQLTASAGLWTDGTELAFRWAADGAPINGATGSTYTVRSGDLGATITVDVTGTRDGYVPATRTSSATSVVTEGTLSTEVPSIAGAAVVDNQLVASTGTWTDGTVLAYRWLANGIPVEGATTSTYTVSVGDLGKQLVVELTGSRAGYTTATRTSAATAPVAAAATVIGTPSVTGTARVGKKLTATPGTLAAGSTAGYQWFANGKPIAKATGKTLSLAAAQRGKRITVVVTATRTGYATASAASTASATVAAGKLATTKPRVKGTVRVGRTLRVVSGDWTSGTRLTYRWYANGKKIAGATKARYSVSAKFAGKKITVRVTGKKSGYTTVAKRSVAKRVAR